MINFELMGIDDKNFKSKENINMLNVILISIANSRKILSQKELKDFDDKAKEGIYIQSKKILHELNLTTLQYEIILQLISTALEI